MGWTGSRLGSARLDCPELLFARIGWAGQGSIGTESARLALAGLSWNWLGWAQLGSSELSLARMAETYQTTVNSTILFGVELHQKSHPWLTCFNEVKRVLTCFNVF